jgi:outer membrane protein
MRKYNRVLPLFCAALAFLAYTVTTTAQTAPAAAQPAQDQASAPPVRTALINMQDAITGTAEGKKEFETLKAKFKPKEEALRGLNDQVQVLKKELSAKDSTLTPEQRTQKTKDMNAKEKTLQQDFQSFQSEAQQAQQDAIGRVGEKLVGVIEQYAKTHGYAVVLDVANPQTPVIYGDERVNITKDVVAAYDSKYPVAAAQPAAAPAPAAK